jgi:hypothetical protein
MRTFAAIALFSPAVLVFVVAACGNAPVKVPETAPVASAGPSDASSAVPTGPGTTTTHVEEDAGLGTKLEPKGEGRGKDDIMAQVTAHKKEARACYDKQASKNPKLEGDVAIKWVADPEGKITNVEVDPAQTNVGDETIGKCVIDVVKTFTFPASAKKVETHMQYKWNFKRNLDQFRAARDAGVIQQ